ncbi:MAG: NTP transferase domain-containing protein [Sinobacteraceae bacterium]|nr:NTP transferase domain-containing protein [Nevskiaceae bacterium]
MNAPVYGLLLAGGRSSRMHRDKAALEYHGRSQLAHAFDLLTTAVEQVFVSVRPDQQDDAVRRGYPQIVDQRAGLGPLAGILAAQAARPDAAWLVLACDLPFLEARTLSHLLASRDAAGLATAFRSAHDGLPEPLCAIYEPRSAAALLAWADTGRSCPRKFLIQSGARLLEPLDPRALDNVNSADEYWNTMQTLAPDQIATAQRIRVQYFALLREQAGRSEETIETRARTPRELYDELRGRHPFTLGAELLRVAVNAEFGDWEQPLAAGDTVVFIPPVAGG